MKKLLVLLVLMALLIISPALHAKIKFRGKPAPECKTFWITEVGGFRTMERYMERYVGEFGLNSEFGLMFNLNKRSALGATIFHQIGADLSGMGFKVRYRHWLNSSFSVDISPGLLLWSEWEAPTFTGHVGLNYKDWVALIAQIDHQRGILFSRKVFSLGIKFGSYVGIVPSILLTLLFYAYSGME